jgi:hypothetical protein
MEDGESPDLLLSESLNATIKNLKSKASASLSSKVYGERRSIL